MSSLTQYLTKYKISKSKKDDNDNDSKITHTRIPDSSNKITGGAYCIPEDEVHNLYNLLYNELFVKGNKEYLTESQLRDNNGCDRPLVIDFDFHYDSQISERQHDKDNILEIICLLLHQLKEMFDFSSNESNMTIYVFERTKPYLCTKKRCTKDGIHLLFGMKVNTLQQNMLRESFLSQAGSVLSDLPLINSYGEVYDSGITNGTTAWQLYGCRKPGRESYKLSHYYSIDYKQNINDFECDLHDGNQFDIKENYKLLSVQYRNNPLYNMTSEFETLYNNKKNNVNVKKNFKTMKIRDNDQQLKDNANVIPIENIKTKKDLLDTLEVLHNNLSRAIDTQYGSLTCKLKETHDITMILPSKYYDEFDAWLKVGWALYNTCNCDYMFYTWMLFSSQSDKFNYNDITTYYGDKYWQSFKQGNDCLTNQSIIYWAKNHWKNITENNKFDEIMNTSLRYFMDQSVKTPTDFDIARVLYHFCKSKFVCTDIKNNTWWEYTNNRWNETDNGVSLSLIISTDMHKLYFDEMKIITGLLRDCDNNDDEWKGLKEKLSGLTQITIRLKEMNKKDKLMKASKELFYDKYFYNKIDENPKLLGVKNGIIDFNENTFREGKSTDYVTKNTKVNYIPLEQIKPSLIKEINDFMNSLFPKPDLCEYMWDMLASCLIGNNYNQTFHIFTGSGSNGKSLLMCLMRNVLGEYYGDVPIAIVCEKRPNIGSVSPEIMQLKGTRLAVINEPSKGQRLNEGPMKALTGGDPIQGRSLFKNTVSFQPQFKLAVCTNVLFDISATDNGTWRRIKVVPYLSTFCNNPDPNAEFEYQIDYNLEEKMLKKWVEPFMSMLIHRAFESKGIIRQKCSIVDSKSQEYRNNQDHIVNFINEKIVSEPGEKVKKGELGREFEEWYKINYGRKDKPKMKELYDVMDKKFGRYVNLGWQNIKIVYDDNDDLNN